MANNVDKFVTIPEHSALDHTGLPGVGGGGGTTIVGAEVIESDAEMGTGILTKTIPANTLTVDNQSLHISYAYDTGTSGTPSLEITAAGISVYNQTQFSANLPRVCNLWFTRTGATTARVVVRGINNLGTGGIEVVTSSSLTFDWSISRDIVFTFTGGTNESHIYYQALKWPEAGAIGISGIGSDTLPTGSIIPYGGTIASVPAGFLPCDGSLADQAVEADLFAVIGSTWNLGGEPGGFFRLPDFRGKSIVGLNDGTLPAGADGGFTTRTLAALGGEEAHGLTAAEGPVHSHTTNNNMSNGTGTDTTRVAAGTTPDLATALGGIQNSGSGTAHNTMHPFAVCPYIIKSTQVGGGIGVTAQNNGGALQGSQPTLNFIPSGGAGVTVVEDVGQNRIDITISAPAASGFTSVSVPRNRTGTGTTPNVSTLDLTSGGSGGAGLVFVLGVLAWDDANDSVSIGVYDGTGTPTSFALAFQLTGGTRVSADRIGMTQDVSSSAILDDNNGAGGVPRIERSSGTGLFHGFGLGIRLT